MLVLALKWLGMGWAKWYVGNKIILFYKNLFDSEMNLCKICNEGISLFLCQVVNKDVGAIQEEQAFSVLEREIFN
jgi:hypothetical protein